MAITDARAMRALLLTWALSATIVGLAVGLATPPAIAELPAELERAYQGAKADLVAGRPARALETFEKLLAQVGEDEEERWQMLLGVALARERLDRPLAAHRTYARVRARMSIATAALTAEWTRRRAAVDAKLADLERELLSNHGVLRLTSEPTGAAVWLDGDRLADARTPTRLIVAPGAHTLRLLLPEHAPATSRVKVGVGEEVRHRAVLAKREPPPGPAETQPGHTNELLAQGPVLDAGPSTPGVVVTAAGGALVVGGVIAYVLAAEDVAAMEDLEVAGDPAGFLRRYNDLESSVRTKETVAWTLWGTGAAALVTGVVLLLTHDPSTPAPLTVAPGGGSVTLWF